MIALAMILAMWIAVRMTFIALGGDPVCDDRQLALEAHAVPAAPTVPPLSGQPHDREREAAGLATLAVPYVLRRSSGAGPRRLAHVGGGDRAGPAGGNGSVPVRSAAGTDGAAVPDERAAVLEASLAAEPDRNAPRLLFLAAQRPDREGDGGEAPHPAAQRKRQGLPRWSADGWLLLRAGNSPPALAAAATAYGASQAGAVLRYGLAPASPLHPQVYVRASGALGARVRQQELALGLMVRPLPQVPISLLGEWRLQQQPGQTRSRPVFMAVTRLPPLRLPLDVEAEAYAQGGWAGGAGATPFFDLSATVQRPVLRPLPGTQFGIGGGVWSGGQRGAVRLDVGPRIELRGLLGPPSRRIGVRIGVDWRFRVAGKAEPGSGPAVTVAAGF